MLIQSKHFPFVIIIQFDILLKNIHFGNFYIFKPTSYLQYKNTI